MQLAHAVIREPPRVALADLRVRRRAQVELGERGAQVEARPADDERTPPGGDQAVDLRVGAACVLARPWRAR